MLDYNLIKRQQSTSKDLLSLYWRVTIACRVDTSTLTLSKNVQ